jgi:hypothetical protein
VELAVDRNAIFEVKRQHYQSQNLEVTVPSTEQKFGKTVTTNWKDHSRNRTKSLINFLQHSKSVPDKLGRRHQSAKPSPDLSSFVDKNIENDEFFEPLGEQYAKEKLYQESLKSDTFSVTSRQESSLKMSKIGGISQTKESKKYLRKGTRVREILARQLQSA